MNMGKKINEYETAGFQISEYDELSSTNTEAERWPKEELKDKSVILTYCQTQGRGQATNRWESEPGKNLSMTVVLCPPDCDASRQFAVSMVCALGVCDFVGHYAEGGKVKWPNDIYVEDRKICGILIENRLSGFKIERSIAGIGINVNQTTFTSDAPNPVSIIHLTKKELSLRPLLEKVCTEISDSCHNYIAAPDTGRLKADFMKRLYRGDGREYLFREPNGEPFMASITDVALTGHLSLSNGHTYAFKEIAYII